MPTIEFTERAPGAHGQAATAGLARAAAAAARAPSVFNSQPWRWRITDSVAELRADRTRQLEFDPDGRLLAMSCGAALHHARTALAGAGLTVAVTRLPDPADPDLLARLRVTGSGHPQPDAVRRQRAMALRHTDRRPFADVAVPAGALRALRAAAEDEGAHLHLLDPRDVATLAVAASRAAAAEFADPAYRMELAAWTHRPAGAGDGVPRASGAAVAPRPVPLRDFGPGAPAGTDPAGTDPAGTDPADRQARYAVLFTDADTPAAWLAAGEALSAVLLAAELERLAASPMSDVVEVPAARGLLRDLLGGIGHPALALRVGVPGDGPPPDGTPRRPAADTVEVVSGEDDAGTHGR
jgi:nitroreductase